MCGWLAQGRWLYCVTLLEGWVSGGEIFTNVLGSVWIIVPALLERAARVLSAVFGLAP